MSKTWQMPPSQVLHLDHNQDPYVCWCLDEAIYLFGTWAEDRLDQVQDVFLDNDTRVRKGRIRAAVQEELLEILYYGSERPQSVPRGMYRDPATMIRQSR